MNMVNDTLELKHGDLVILNGKKGYIGTVRGFAQQYTGVSAKYNTDPEIAYQKALSRKEELYWIGQEAAMLCGDKGYYESYKAKWNKAINLVEGQIVKIEGQLLKVYYKGNYSDMGSFVK